MRTVSKILAVSLTGLLLSACSVLLPKIDTRPTPYQKFRHNSIYGGYQTHIGPGNHVEIDFYANGYTASNTVVLYDFYRCAEYTKEQGKKYFVMYLSFMNAALNKPLRYPVMFNALKDDINEAYAIVYVSDTSRKGAYNAEQVLAYYRDKVLNHR